MATQNNNEAIDKTQFYDKQIYPLDAQSILKLIIYLPIGLILFVIRFIFLTVNYFLCSSNLKPSQIGLNVKFDGNLNDLNDQTKKYVFIGNHVTYFDYFVLRHVYSGRRLTLLNVNEPTTSIGVLNRVLLRNEPSVTTSKHSRETIDLSQFIPNSLVYFPENTMTNGKYGILKFNFDAFGSVQDFGNVKFIPIAIHVERKYLDFCVNQQSLSQTWSVLFTLFTPQTNFFIRQLTAEEKRANESVNELAVRLQRRIGSSLNVKCTNESIDDTIEDDDGFGGIIRQVNEVLPHLNVNLIRQHVQLAQALDIDTIITSLLDKYPNVVEPSAPTTTQQPKPQTQVKKYLTYLERKRLLLDEARQRFIENEEKSQ